MMLVGVTGGIGAGKSTVAASLARRGAKVVDADAIAHAVLAPGGPAYRPVVDRFGSEVLRPDGWIDRAKLATRVFGHPEALAELNAITHPLIRDRIADEVALLDRPGRVVLLDIPLLGAAGAGREDLRYVIVVDVPEEVAVRRLVDQRNLTEGDARARIAAQISREERRALADVVIDNSGSRDALSSKLDRLWEWLRREADIELYSLPVPPRVVPRR